jgi:hypothetical protein
VKRLALMLTLSALTSLAFITSAQAEFGFKNLQVAFPGSDGFPSMQAGSHPYGFATTVELKTIEVEPGKELPDGELRDLTVTSPLGIVGNPTAVPRCSTATFIAISDGAILCPPSTVIGLAEIKIGFGPTSTSVGLSDLAPVSSLPPPPGVAARLGFFAVALPVIIDVTVTPEPPYRLRATLTNTSQIAQLFGSRVTIWGDPSDSSHDAERVGCGKPSCPVEDRGPFLTSPRSCTGPLVTEFWGSAWNTEEEATGTATTEPGFTGCAKLGFSPTISSQPTTKAAQSPTGLDFGLDVTDEGLTNPKGLADSDIRKTIVTLPPGMSVNPAVADGLEICTKAQLERETPFSDPGAGCPNASKIGSVEIETPLLEDQILKGSVYQAQQDDPATGTPGTENPFDSLIALYVVIKEPKLGIIVEQPLEVVPNPVTGQLVTIAEDMPQLPFSHFRFHFREGARSPLASPPTCGTHQVKAQLFPWSGGPSTTATSEFEIISGPGAGPCPTGGLPPFKPGLIAGTLNNAAGKYSPFNLRLSRSDSEQEFTRFSIKLPPGITGKLAGIPYCPDAALEAAKQRTGTAEEQSPSCPKASEVGRTLVGAGVGPSPAYAPGKLYLAGPYNGSALSIAAITAAKVGPFDLGTVVVRQALKIDRETAEVFIDATGSDPIPHIIDGVVVHARDIRAYVDRPSFVLNPTSCERTSTASTVLGSGLNFASEADDNPIVVSSPFQAADCASLPFNPKLSFRLSGGTKRGAHPKLRAVLQMRPGEANIAKARVTLPRSAFLDQSHIGTVCTRVQYAQDACPARSIYGYAKALSPLFDTPIEGPIYLRSSEHKLPDLVAAFRNGQIKFDLVGRIDSLKGRIRNAFELVPDAPVTSAVFSFMGGNKGLIINSTNLCKGTQRAVVELDAHSGKTKDFRPLVKAAGCGKAAKRGKRR